MDMTMFSLTVNYDGGTLLTTLPCDPHELENQLGSIGLAHSQDTLRFDAIPNVSMRVAPMDRRGVLLEPLIDERTTLYDLNRACVGIYRSDWLVKGTVCGKLAEKKYGSVKEVADDCTRLNNRNRAKAR